LLPTSDQFALFVADHAQELAAHYTFPLQNAQLSHTLINKNSMFQLARQHGIPSPYTVRPESKQELFYVLGTAHYPLIVKTDASGREPTPPKCIVHSQSEFWEKQGLGLIPNAFNFVIQEYIPGHQDTAWMFNGYFNHSSECLFGMTGRKLRQCPAYTGSACLAVCLPNEAIQRTTLQFAKAIEYKGMLDVDYRYDRRDELYKIVDFNPRIGASFRLFLDAYGMDVVRAMYLDLAGQRIYPAETCYGRKWMVEDQDLISGFRYFRDGSLSLAEWLRSYRGLQELSWFSFTDPVPAFAMLASDIRKLPSKLHGPSGSPEPQLHLVTGKNLQGLDR
jgi:predicted ATP-grasp superfamily ATP-dependent carboligase